MRKITRVLAGMMAVAALTLTSCSDDEETLAPSITSDSDGTTIEALPGETITVNATVYKGDNNLDRITIREDGNIIDVDQRVVTIGGESLESDGDFNDPNQGLIEIMIEMKDEEKIYNYSIAVIDKDGNSDNIEFKVNVMNEANETPLSAEKTATLTYKSASQTDGANILTEAMLKYSGNVDANTARFRGNTASVMFVEVASVAGYATMEDLAAAYNAGSKMETFTVEADALFSEKIVIASDGTNYSLIQFTDLTFGVGNNQADVSYKVSMMQ